MRSLTDRHPADGTLRRLVDEPAGVSDADRAHVAGCAVCLAGLAAAQRDATAVATALDHAAAPDVDAAWRRFSAASDPRHWGQSTTCSRSDWATPTGSSSSRRSTPSVG